MMLSCNMHWKEKKRTTNFTACNGYQWECVNGYVVSEDDEQDVQDVETRCLFECTTCYARERERENIFGNNNEIEVCAVTFKSNVPIKN